jgi:nucleotide-binding universal stress UspA family protein
MEDNVPTLDHIICPVDLSDCSARALTYAAAWAHWYEADLRILHVVPLPVPVAGAGGGIVMATTYPPLETVRAQVRAFVDGVPRVNVPTSLQVVEGDPVDTILDVSRRQPRTMLVMGSHGRTGLERILNRSVTEGVTHHASGPVLVVPAHEAGFSPDQPLFKRILCAVDFLPSSLEGLRHALVLAQQVDAAVHVIHVLETAGDEQAVGLRHFSVPEYLAAQHRFALGELRGQIPAEARDWCTVHEQVVAGHPARQLLRLASEIVADLIVMGSGDRFHLRSIWLGGVADRLMRAAHAPVLIIPPTPDPSR